MPERNLPSFQEEQFEQEVANLYQEDHKGHIAEVGTPGQGACFEIYLPLD